MHFRLILYRQEGKKAISVIIFPQNMIVGEWCLSSVHCTYGVLCLFCRVCSVSHLIGALKLSPDQFKHKFKVDQPNKDDENIVFHCKSGIRSLIAIVIAKQFGYTK